MKSHNPEQARPRSRIPTNRRRGPFGGLLRASSLQKRKRPKNADWGPSVAGDDPGPPPPRSVSQKSAGGLQTRLSGPAPALLLSPSERSRHGSSGQGEGTVARPEGLEGRLGGGEKEKNEDGRQAEKSAAPAQRHLGPLLQRRGGLMDWRRAEKVRCKTWAEFWKTRLLCLTEKWACIGVFECRTFQP